MEWSGAHSLYWRSLTAGAATWSSLYCLYKGCAHQNDQIPKNPGLCALVAYIAGDTLHHQPMGVSHMTVLQLCGPMGLCVLQWCHPMLACVKRTSYCTQIITLYCARKVDSGPCSECFNHRSCPVCSLFIWAWGHHFWVGTEYFQNIFWSFTVFSNNQHLCFFATCSSKVFQVYPTIWNHSFLRDWMELINL